MKGMFIIIVIVTMVSSHINQPTGLPSFTLKDLPVSSLASQSVKTFHAFQGVRAPLVVKNVQPVTSEGSGSIQQLHVSGGQLQYIRFVSSASSGENNTLKPIYFIILCVQIKVLRYVKSPVD
jgi:hypothetical protein